LGNNWKGFYESKDLTDFENFKEGDKKIPYQVLAECKGADLVGIKYEQLMPLVPHIKMPLFRVISGDFVTIDDGTGSFTRHRLWCR
jgi:isoleucyl-tRNA synthetase